MHFSIPDMQQFHDDNGISYTGYNIYIDGFFHCTTRYKQLLCLHEQLVAQYPYSQIPHFPPKKLIILTSSQLEERRVLLEKYLQLLGQHPAVAKSDLLITFLYSAQQETHSVSMHEVDIDISLMNGYRIPLLVSSTDSSSTLLDIACSHINLPKDMVKYFSLYLFNWSCAKDGRPAFKKLEEYESPYISQKYVRPEDKIVLRKSYWDPCYDVDLMIDRVSIDLLYLQIIEELDLGWVTADSESKLLLSAFEAKKQRKKYIELAKTLRHYARIPAGEATIDSSSLGISGAGQMRVRVALASKELTLSSIAQPHLEHRYKVTRMRCWRITTLHVDKQQFNSSLLEEPSINFELSFEYLISKENLKWITLRTEHATFISVCLQSIVDELMCQKVGEGPSSPRSSRRGTGSLTYLRRDGSTHLVTPSSSSDTISSANGDSLTSGSSREMFSVQKLTEKFASVAFKPGKDCVENNAFEAIGDEAL